MVTILKEFILTKAVDFLDFGIGDFFLRDTSAPSLKEKYHFFHLRTCRKTTSILNPKGSSFTRPSKPVFYLKLRQKFANWKFSGTFACFFNG